MKAFISTISANSVNTTHLYTVQKIAAIKPGKSHTMKNLAKAVAPPLLWRTLYNFGQYPT